MTTIKPATPLPWAQVELDQFNGRLAIIDGEDFCVARALRNFDPVGAEKNAAYIVHACNTLPRLEAENAELKAALRKLTEAVEGEEHYYRERTGEEYVAAEELNVARALLVKLVESA